MQYQQAQWNYKIKTCTRTKPRMQNLNDNQSRLNNNKKKLQ